MRIDMIWSILRIVFEDKIAVFVQKRLWETASTIMPSA
jgi:hypothetical protein